MTDDKNHDLDDLIRAASNRDVDEGTIFRSVLGKIDDAEDRRGWFSLPAFGPGTAVAGFAAMMVVAGFAGYSLPGLSLGAPEEDFLVLAMGGDALTNGFLGGGQ